MEYYAKIKLYYNQAVPIHQVALKIFGADEDNAKTNCEEMIYSWQNIEKFEILKISVRPIQLFHFRIYSVLKYRNGNSRNLTFKIDAESEKDASQLVMEIIQRWEGIVSYHFESIEKN
ncbi:MAG: hypothetical protein JW833_05960 [Prolixibacteraceae bacterium]|nr:hypothetical protein [Prolixibacteraceae bacterium]